MTFRKAKVIYGVYMNAALQEFCEEVENGGEDKYPTEYELGEFFGFEDEYSASGPEYLCWLGQEITGVDTFSPFPVSDLAGLTLPEEEIDAVNRQIEALPESIKKLLPPTDFYVIWYDS